MNWTVKLSKKSVKVLAKINKIDRQKILQFINEVLPSLDNPRNQGKALKGGLRLWRYRIGSYRLICEIKDQELVIVVVTLGHRKQVYKK